MTITSSIRLCALALLGLLMARPAAAQSAGSGAQPITVNGCRPLLAPDCVIDDMVEEVAVLTPTRPEYECVLDANLTNSANISQLVGIDATYSPILSIRDLNHTYAGGQEAGFVVGSGSALLSASLLNRMYITFYKNNEQVGEPQPVKADQVGLLSLNLLSTEGQRTLKVTAPGEFDEIMLCATGVADVEVLSSGTNIYYGFVGDVQTKLQNPASGSALYKSEISERSLTGWGIWKDNNLVNGTPYQPNDDFLGALLNAGFGLRVTFLKPQDIPDYAEVGFVYSNADLASLDLLKSVKFIVSDGKNEKEYTVSTSFVSVDALSGQKDAAYTIRINKDELGFSWDRITLDVTCLKAITGLLGQTSFKYAYIKPIDMPAASHNLGLAADALICATDDEYILTSDTEVKWALTRVENFSGADITQEADVNLSPADGFTQRATVTFRSAESGRYTFTATDADGCTGTITITRGKSSAMKGASLFCGTPLDAHTDHVALTQRGGGALIAIDDLDNAANLLDGSLTTYASYARGLQLASNTCVVSVRKTGGATFSEDEAVMGFVAETPVSAVGAGVLTYYNIVLYDADGQELYRAATGENDGVGVSVIGAPGSGMVRYAVTVPEQYRGQVAEFALYTSGVLNLDLTAGSLKLYNAFTADEGCAAMPAGPLKHQGLTPLNAAAGATLNYAATGSLGALASVVGVSTRLGDLMQNDVTHQPADELTGAEAYTVAGVLQESGVAVRTGRVYPGGRWVGLVMKQTGGLADVSLLQNLKLTLYREGKAVIENEEQSGLLTANLISMGDLAYLSVYADPARVAAFDEVRFTKGQLAAVAEHLQLLGFYTYADADGDGIPDAEDPDFCPDDVVIELGKPTVAADINSLCATQADDKFTVTVSAPESVHYTVTDRDRDTLVLSGNLSAEAEAPMQFTLRLSDLPKDESGALPLYGRYAVRVSLPGQPLFEPVEEEFIVHANHTQWAPQMQEDGTYSQDWNLWENWTQGVPVIGCTNVSLPGSAPAYPVLKPYGSGSAPADFNSCQGLYFAFGAEALGLQHLSYEKAWVDLELAGGRYYMLSAPLKGMVTGDFFIPAEMNGQQNNELFYDLTALNSPASRFSPRIYQRLWLRSAPVENGTNADFADEKEVKYDETRWTPPFNALRQEYTAGMGFSLKADLGDLPAGTTLRFRFPKTHTEYYYFNEKNQQTDFKETITRPDDAGRLYTLGQDGTLTLTLTADEESTVMLAGNPLMAHIDIAKFFEENSGVTSIKVYDGNAMNSAVLADGELLTNTPAAPHAEWTHIAPMQSFFVTTSQSATELPVTLTEDMLATLPGAAHTLRSAHRPAADAAAVPTDRVLITATTPDGVSAGAMVRLADGARADFVEGEDAPLLVDNEVRPQVQLFTLAGNRAADVQQAPAATDRLTLGVLMAQSGPLQLRLSGDTRWTLLDTQTGASYDMAGGTAASLPAAGSSTGRYVLVRQGLTGLTGATAAADIVVSRTDGGAITVQSAGGALGPCAVYTADGRLVSRSRGGVATVRLTGAPGVCLVSATRPDGTVYTQKIY